MTLINRIEQAGEGERDPFAEHRIRGGCVPVFHNLCGRRTTYRQCQCDHCSAILKAGESG